MIDLTKEQCQRALEALGYNGVIAEKGTIEKPKGGWLRLYLRIPGTQTRAIKEHYMARHGEQDLAMTNFILTGVRANG